MTYKLTQLVKEATRTTSDTKTLIAPDIIVNRTDLVSDGGVNPCWISDHDVT